EQKSQVEQLKQPLVSQQSNRAESSDELSTAKVAVITSIEQQQDMATDDVDEASTMDNYPFDYNQASNIQQDAPNNTIIKNVQTMEIQPNLLTLPHMMYD